jgi:predicted ATP-grasp superfamily ATP-dependent carboligase
MRVFVYEYMTATGTGRDPGLPEHGMYLEGRAMRDAVVEDFERIGTQEVFTFPNKASPVDSKWFEEVCRFSDWTLIIAPESDGALLSCLASVEWASGHLLGPSRDAIQLTSDKLALANHWRTHEVPTPATTDREPTACEAFPVMWKPQDGAGSTNTFLLNSALDATRAKAQLATQEHPSAMILQEFVPGRAASVAFLCGPRGNVPLLPTFQLLSDDGRFKYQGGELPIPPALASRAVKLASRAVEGVSGLLGYVGVDLVLGDAEDGSRDYAIEINPRLTTSYIGLRAVADFNLAEAMLKVARGEETGELRWKPGRVRFGPEGAVWAV